MPRLGDVECDRAIAAEFKVPTIHALRRDREGDLIKVEFDFMSANGSLQPRNAFTCQMAKQANGALTVVKIFPTPAK